MKKEIKKNPHNPAHTSQQKGIPVNQELIQVQHQHSGPLPDPRSLAAYDDIVPGSAERILIMAERNSEHAIHMDREILQAELAVSKQNHTESIRGQYCGIIGVLAMAGVAAYAIEKNCPTVAGIICSTTIVGLVAIFVTGRRTSSGGKSANKDES